MAGPNVELFKFGLYLFFPLAIMIHVGDPDWYERHVRPVSFAARARATRGEVVVWLAL